MVVGNRFSSERSPQLCHLVSPVLVREHKTVEAHFTSELVTGLMAVTKYPGKGKKGKGLYLACSLKAKSQQGSGSTHL